MPRSTDRQDDYARALDIGLAGADRLHRATTRAALVLERARAGVRAAEARRLAAKYGTKESEAAAQAASRQQALRVEAATQAAERSHVERVHPASGHAVVHGRIRTGKPAELDVLAVGEGDKPIARARTDKRGYFKLDVPLKEATSHTATTRLPVVENVTVSAAPAAVRIIVRRGERQLHRDDTGTPIRPGRAVYREIAIAEGET